MEELCPFHEQGGYYSHQHVLWTSEFMESWVPEQVRALYFPLRYDTGPGPLAAHHHRSRSLPYDSVLAMADHLQSEERGSRPEDSPGGNFRQVRLRSLFPGLSILGKRGTGHYYSLATLGANWAPCFPIQGAALGDQQEYRSLKESFKESWQKLMESCTSLRPSFPVFMWWCMSALQRDFWCVPADTMGGLDISLYDHLRMTSALALAVHRSADNQVSLVAGDISGVQDFIYRLRSPAGGRGVSKVLRGRSFFLTLLAEFLARCLANRLDLSPANVIWVGGGNFLLLAPSGTEAALSHLCRDIETWLFQQFRGELGLVVCQQEFGTEEIAREFSACWDEVNQGLQKAKGKKLVNSLMAHGSSLSEPGEHCDMCGSFPKETEGLCGHCLKFRDLGARVPQAGAIAFLSSGTPQNALWEFPVGGLGCIALYQDPREAFQSRVPREDIFWVTDVREPESTMGFRPVAHQVPRYQDSGGLPRALRLGLEEPPEAGDVASNLVLAHASSGDALLGVLRADVDHLGLALSTGLDERTPSRLGTLSRMLDWYFSGYVDYLAAEAGGWQAGLGQEWAARALSGLVYIGYSGGDDLFALGPWDVMVAFALHVREEFKRFVGAHPALDMSAGLFLCSGSFPIGRAAHLAGDMEHEAKEKGRRRIYLLGRVLPWELAHIAVGLGLKLKLLVKEEEVPRRLLFKLLESLREPAFFWPNAYYAIARSAKAEARDYIVQELQGLRKATGKRFHDVLHVALEYGRLATGGEGT